MPKQVQKKKNNDDDDAFASPAASPPVSGKKKPKAGDFQDELRQMNIEESKRKSQRIKSRFLHLMIVGYFMDVGDEEKPAQKEERRPKKSKKSDDQDWSFSAIKERFGGPFFMLMFVAVVFGARIAGEDFSVDFSMEGQDNFYDVIGVPSDVEVITLRKAYKKLALELHPDKNPDCAECATRFAKISKAYETLNDPERRTAYDARKSHGGALKTATSVDLTDETFESEVFRSNEVWYVQVYDPTDSLCKNFHPAWEEVAMNHEKMAKFGRLDMKKNQRAMRLLPQRVLMTPVVFRFARGLEPEIFQWSWSAEERGGQPLSRFVLEQFPAMPQIESAAELKNWWAGATAQTQKILITGASKAKSVEFMQVARLAHMWEGYIEMAQTDPSTAQKALGDEFDPKYDWLVALKGAAVETKTVLDADLVAGAMQELIGRSMSPQAPAVTVRNYQQLCGSHGSRNLCLLLIDDDSRIPKALQELKTSRETYTQEVADLKQAELDDPSAVESGEEGSTEETLNIQAVRVTSQSSRMPWAPIAFPRAFHGLWSEVEYSKAFLLDLENKRISAIKSKSFGELYQGVGYDDVKFRDVPEDFSFARAMPDPETSLRREFGKLFSTIPGIIIGYVLFSAMVSVFPELEPIQLVGGVSGGVALLTLVWPLMCRKAILMFWCVGSSAMECQI